ncbi:MAG: hypothetical protein A2231_13115 [Candidatus Firestonebacteria bacterium RIFOXYA2_FULL_40_8]|nr:MAG: hypothetical protein A2231_13115 [Candidatus Firestonebacteria bacterium RIFOXYA2_FULL_40_8]
MRKKAFVVKTTPKYILGLALLVPLVFYYLTVYLYAVNVPLSDDFPTVLGFLTSFFSLNSLSEKLRLLFSQHNEYRIVLSRLVSLLVYKINGVIDFRILIFTGNIMLLPALYAVYSSFKKNKDKLKYFLPAVFVIAVPQFIGSIFWTTSALQNISCLAFSLITFALLKKEGALRTLTAFAFALLAVFSSGNGLLLLPAVIFFLLITKRKKTAFYWSAGTLFVLLGYFYGYTTPVHEKVYYAVNPLSIVEFFFIFLGSPVVFSVGYMKSLLGANAELIIRSLSIISGGAVIAYFIYLTKKKYYRANPVIFIVFILFFITAAAAAVTRSGIGPMQAFASRYRIIPLFLFALVYLSFIEITKEKTAEKYYKYILILAVVFSIFSYIANLPAIKSGRDNLVLGITAWQKTGTGLERLNDDPIYAENQFKKALEKGIYLPEK